MKKKFEDLTDGEIIDLVDKFTSSCKFCSKYGACPFSYSDESQKVQNYGCLPTPMDIINMRVKHNKTWACHDNPDKPCLGGLTYLRKKGLPYKVVDKELLTLDNDWHLYCD